MKIIRMSKIRTPKKTSPFYLAMSILEKIEKDNSYSNLLLNEAHSKKINLSQQMPRLLTDWYNWVFANIS